MKYRSSSHGPIAHAVVDATDLKIFSKVSL